MGGGGGAGVSEAGGKGALALFGEVKAAMTDSNTPFLPSKADEAAAAKAAADAYAGVKNPLAAPKDAMMQANADLDIPDLDLGDGKSDMANTGDIGKAINDMVAGMGDLLNQAFSSPIGFIGSLINFLFKMFTELASTALDMLNEIARAAAAAIEDAAKKQLQAQSSTGLQSLELFNQSATTQTLSHALKSGAST